MIFYFSLGILIIGFGASLGRRFFDPKYIFAFSVLLIFFLLFYQSFEQYDFWGKSEIFKFFLPPYQNVNYFLFYVGLRIFAPYFISLFAALAFLWLAKLLNRKYEERFFYPEELWMGALSIFLVSHPGWLVYLISIISIYLLLHIFSLPISRFALQRFSIYYLWIPGAIFVILINGWLQTLPIWQMLKF